jgi:glycosyltransferase involved in cell wall biosynthesis
MPDPLRILVIVNLPWDRRLGAARVWIELADAWMSDGHHVEKFCLTDAFPKPASSNVRSIFRQLFFPSRAAAYVRANADRFDVIDCLIGTMPFQKSALNFRGLLVARSVGLFRLYAEFLRKSRERWPDQPKGRFLGRIFHRLTSHHFRKNAETSIRVCDLICVPNDDEREALARDPSIRAPAFVQPYGLNDDFFEAFVRAAAPAAERLAAKKICFIGMWSLRKGSRDWPQIMETIWCGHPDAQFVFLGTMSSAETVRAELGLKSEPRITCLPTYAANDLPSLLADAALALFPTYVEGFGLAVLEQLAAGLPTISYDVPGPREILEPLRERLLTPAGEPAAMAARAAEILAFPLTEYETLSAACVEIARPYRWRKFAAATITHYREALHSLGRENEARR